MNNEYAKKLDKSRKVMILMMIIILITTIMMMMMMMGYNRGSLPPWRR
jgi:hypothetical protein